MVIALIIGFGSSCFQLVNIKVKTKTNSQAQGTDYLENRKVAIFSTISFFFFFLIVSFISQIR